MRWTLSFQYCLAFGLVLTGALMHHEVTAHPHSLTLSNGAGKQSLFRRQPSPLSPLSLVILSTIPRAVASSSKAGTAAVPKSQALMRYKGPAPTGAQPSQAVVRYKGPAPTGAQPSQAVVRYKGPAPTGAQPSQALVRYQNPASAGAQPSQALVRHQNPSSLAGSSGSSRAAPGSTTPSTAPPSGSAGGLPKGTPNEVTKTGISGGEAAVLAGGTAVAGGAVGYAAG